MDWEFTIIETYYHGHIDDQVRGKPIGSVIFDVRFPPWKRWPKWVIEDRLYLWHIIRSNPELHRQFLAWLEAEKKKRKEARDTQQ